MKREFLSKRLSAKTLAVIEQADEILSDYFDQGYVLTLRQLYYQFVARGLLANVQQNYKRLGSIISDGRLCGLIDWSHMEDRGRKPAPHPHWDGPAEIVRACASQFEIDKWAGQEHYVEVWAEKDAVSSILEPLCQRLDVTFMANRGYSSQSAMYEGFCRIAEVCMAGYVDNGLRKPVIIYVGDHDPSGLDMDRDITDRLSLFMGRAPEFVRAALIWDQIEEHSPPPNPAKITDSRYQRYAEDHGEESWELDALEPKTLEGIVEGRVLAYRDEKAWKRQCKVEKEHRKRLKQVVEELEDEETSDV